jgi:hypothetical protein
MDLTIGADAESEREHGYAGEAGALRSWRRAKAASLKTASSQRMDRMSRTTVLSGLIMAEGCHWIDCGCAASWEIAGDERGGD